MFIEYTQLVLDRYEKKRAASDLSPRLIHPTPGKIRQECMAVFSAGVKRKDQATLNTFFEKKIGEDVDLSTIEKYDRDKFKPLWNLITGRINDTDTKNIELLAWLIDFDQRPYEYGRRYVGDNIISGNDDGSKQANQIADEEEPAIQLPSFSETKKQPMGAISLQTPQKKRLTSKVKAGIIVIIILALAGAATYSLQKSNQEPFGLLDLKPAETCMYWVGDHYEQTPCTQKHGDTLVVALDTLVFRYLRKIDRQDTITLNAIGRVWYIKTNNQIECFTAGGNYPPDPKRKLRPLTKLIIQKYIHPGN